MEVIRSWWEVPCVAHFCHIFQKPFKLPAFEIEEFEDALLLDCFPTPSKLIVEIFCRFLDGIIDTEITEENWSLMLKLHLKWRCDNLKEKWNPLSGDKEYKDLDTYSRVAILHKLCHWRLELDDIGELLRGMDGPSLRLDPVGRDMDGHTYWYFYGTRLYMEESKKKRKKKEVAEEATPKGGKGRGKECPTSTGGKSQSSRKKTTQNKASQRKSNATPTGRKSGRGSRRSRVVVEGEEGDSQVDKEEEEEQEEEGEGSKGEGSNGGDEEKMEVDNCAEAREVGADVKVESLAAKEEVKVETGWRVACTTVEEWNEVLENLKGSKHTETRRLFRVLEDFLPEVEYVFAARDKQLKKRMLSELPRRTSDRIAIKAALREEQERMDALDRELQREELRKFEAEEERAKEEEAEQKRQKRLEEAMRRRKAREEEQQKQRLEEESNWEKAMSGELSGRRKAAIGAAENVSEVQRLTEDFLLTDKDFDLYTAMHKILAGLRKHEEAWIFEEPVTETIAPGYFEVVDKPMDYVTVEKKVEEQAYKTKEEFAADFELIYNNCVDYNGEDSEYAELAEEMRKIFRSLVGVHFEGKSSSEDKPEGRGKKGQHRESRSPSACKTPELTSESSSEEDSEDEGSDDSYTVGEHKHKKPKNKGSVLKLTPSLEQRLGGPRMPVPGQFPGGPPPPHMYQYMQYMQQQQHRMMRPPPHMGDMYPPGFPPRLPPPYPGMTPRSPQERGPHPPPHMGMYPSPDHHHPAMYPPGLHPPGPRPPGSHPSGPHPSGPRPSGPHPPSSQDMMPRPMYPPGANHYPMPHPSHPAHPAHPHHAAYRQHMLYEMQYHGMDPRMMGMRPGGSGMRPPGPPGMMPRHMMEFPGRPPMHSDHKSRETASPSARPKGERSVENEAVVNGEQGGVEGGKEGVEGGKEGEERGKEGVEGGKEGVEGGKEGGTESEERGKDGEEKGEEGEERGKEGVEGGKEGEEKGKEGEEGGKIGEEKQMEVKEEGEERGKEKKMEGEKDEGDKRKEEKRRQGEQETARTEGKAQAEEGKSKDVEAQDKDGQKGDSSKPSGTGTASAGKMSAEQFEKYRLHQQMMAVQQQRREAMSRGYPFPPAGPPHMPHPSHPPPHDEAAAAYYAQHYGVPFPPHMPGQSDPRHMFPPHMPGQSDPRHMEAAHHHQQQQQQYWMEMEARRRYQYAMMKHAHEARKRQQQSGGKERSAETGQEGLEDVPDYQDSLRQYALGLAEQESTSTSSSPAPKDEENSAEGDHSEETSKKKRKVPGHPSNLQPFPMHPPPPHMMPNGYPMPPYHMPPYHPGNHHLPPEGRRNGAGYPPDAYYSPSAHAAPYRVPGYPPPPPPGMSKQDEGWQRASPRPSKQPAKENEATPPPAKRPCPSGSA